MDPNVIITIAIFVLMTMFGLIGIIYTTLTKKTDGNSSDIKDMREKLATKEELKETKSDLKSEIKELKESILAMSGDVKKILVRLGDSNES